MRKRLISLCGVARASCAHGEFFCQQCGAQRSVFEKFPLLKRENFPARGLKDQLYLEDHRRSKRRKREKMGGSNGKLNMKQPPRMKSEAEVANTETPKGGELMLTRLEFYPSCAQVSSA